MTTTTTASPFFTDIMTTTAATATVSSAPPAHQRGVLTYEINIDQSFRNKYGYYYDGSFGCFDSTFVNYCFDTKHVNVFKNGNILHTSFPVCEFRSLFVDDDVIYINQVNSVLSTYNFDGKLQCKLELQKYPDYSRISNCQRLASDQIITQVHRNGGHIMHDIYSTSINGGTLLHTFQISCTSVQYMCIDANGNILILKRNELLTCDQQTGHVLKSIDLRNIGVDRALVQHLAMIENVPHIFTFKSNESAEPLATTKTENCLQVLDVDGHLKWSVSIPHSASATFSKSGNVMIRNDNRVKCFY